MIPVTRARQ